MIAAVDIAADHTGNTAETRTDRMPKHAMMQ